VNTVDDPGGWVLLWRAVVIVLWATPATALACGTLTVVTGGARPGPARRTSHHRRTD
jgi:hypothetical protein